MARPGPGAVSHGAAAVCGKPAIQRPRADYVTVNALQIGLLLVSAFALPRGSKVRLLLRMVGTLALAVAVFRTPRVTSHQLLGAVVVYLNLALLFTGAFLAFDAAFPAACTTATKAPLRPGGLLYFSLTTLTSTGYGDILPVHPLARSLANLEAVIGQLFLAVLLGHLVSQHSNNRGS